MANNGCARVIPLWPPWAFHILKTGKCVENRNTPYGYTITCCKDGYIYLGETKKGDPKIPGALAVRVAPQLPSAVVGAVKIVAILDNSNPEHVRALMGCASTSPWFSPKGKSTSIVFSHCVLLKEPIPYRGRQGYHFLPSDVPPASSLFGDESVQRLLSPEDEAMFAALHIKPPDEGLVPANDVDTGACESAQQAASIKATPKRRLSEAPADGRQQKKRIIATLVKAPPTEMSIEDAEFIVSVAGWGHNKMPALPEDDDRLAVARSVLSRRDELADLAKQQAVTVKLEGRTGIKYKCRWSCPGRGTWVCAIEIGDDNVYIWRYTETYEATGAVTYAMNYAMQGSYTSMHPLHLCTISDDARTRIVTLPDGNGECIMYISTNGCIKHAEDNFTDRGSID